MDTTSFVEGVLASSALWLLGTWYHRLEHLCMPLEKVYVENEDGTKSFYKSPTAIMRKYFHI